jgi:hypothetical protein
MKKVFNIVMIMVMVVCACDKIPADERRTPTDALPDWNGQYVLLQDFTGVRCVNCPASAEEIKRMQTIFGDKLIVIKLHPEMIAFNRPVGTSPDGEGHNQDLSHPQAEQYRAHYNIVSLPKGIVMQKNEQLEKDNFFGKVLSYYARQAVATIDLTANLAGNTISINTNLAFIGNHRGSGNTQLSLIILENNLLVNQYTPSGTISGYNQHNVLRAVVTPLWGDQIAEKTVEAGQTFIHGKTIESDAIWKRENLSVVAILFDNDTKEVIQCAKAIVTL